MIVHEVQPRLILAVAKFLVQCKEVIMGITAPLWWKSCLLKILGFFRLMMCEHLILYILCGSLDYALG